MKLATVRTSPEDLDHGRDGRLVIVNHAGDRMTRADDIVATMQGALDAWEEFEPQLKARSEALNAGDLSGEEIDFTALAAPLPRAYEWVDGSAYLNHVKLVRRARGVSMPTSLTTRPLLYQGGSSVLLGPCDDIELPSKDWGLDFEAEVAVILGDTPRGTTVSEAAKHIRLITMCNDITYRSFVRPELARGFGFLRSKPPTAFGPFAVTPDELGEAWARGKLHGRLHCRYNGVLIGDPELGKDMSFSFLQLIEHMTATRAFGAGTILGSGTVSNEDRKRGIPCLAERRTIETIETGAPKTPFMEWGDRIEIEMKDPSGASVFGKISQEVVPPADS